MRIRSSGILLTLALVLASCSFGVRRDPALAGAAAGPHDYPAYFEKAREMISASEGGSKDRYFETDLIRFLDQWPEKVIETKADLLKELQQESSNHDATKHVRLIPPAGQPGYSELKAFVSHPYYLGDALQPASNLIQVWRDFIQGARKELILNVFDFDLEEVAQDLVELRKKGVSVRVGIDANVIAARPEVKKVHDLLKNGGVEVTAVNPVSLNHQKVSARDWSDPSIAAALLSSGNLTHSCLDPEGDLHGIADRPKESVPNANHVLTMKSWLLANLLFHELSKTLGPSLHLRGSQYPLTGAYQITGPGVDPATLEAYPEPSFIVTFTPGGGFGKANESILAQVIKQGKGPIRLVQFAYSSGPVADALLERAEADLQSHKDFDFQGVGDTPFAMQFWSQFLKMSGLKRMQTEGDKSRYAEDPESPWSKRIAPKDLARIRESVHIAPPVYGNHKVKLDGKSVDVTAKIHHKLMSVGSTAVVGTSFNFSQGAENNNEQIAVFTDRELAKLVEGIARWLIEGSPRTVFEESERRNRLNAAEADDEAVSENVGETSNQ